MKEDIIEYKDMIKCKIPRTITIYGDIKLDGKSIKKIEYKRKKDKTLIFLNKLFKILDKNYFFNPFYDYNNYGLKDYVKYYKKIYKEKTIKGDIELFYSKINKELDKLIKEYVKE